MAKKANWSSILTTIIALAIVYGIGTTFFTIEIERLIEQTITPRIVANQTVSELNGELYSGIDQFMESRHVRLIGYICLVTIVVMSALGLFLEKKGLASLGSLGFILSIYAYFVLHMSFLAGLGILTALWSPFWGKLVKLGDIVYLPYVILVYPFSRFGLDIRRFAAYTIGDIGLLIFVLGVISWFYARIIKKNTADFWIYRFTRHPQFLGWILWSYGLMLLVALRRDTPLGAANPGASLPWVLSTLIIICVALSEEIHMRRLTGDEYDYYVRSAPFMIPLPKFLLRGISFPMHLSIRKEYPGNGRELLVVFFTYTVLIIFFSLPFVLLDWPPIGWATWPLFTYLWSNIV